MMIQRINQRQQFSKMKMFAGHFKLQTFSFLIFIGKFPGMSQFDFWKTHPGPLLNMDEFSRNRCESPHGKLKGTGSN